MPSAQLLGFGPSLVFLQNPNDLLFRETALALGEQVTEL
jgi:hypothetical protein